jgi:hypothetical protein
MEKGIFERISSRIHPRFDEKPLRRRPTGTLYGSTLLVPTLRRWNGGDWNF